MSLPKRFLVFICVVLFIVIFSSCSSDSTPQIKDPFFKQVETLNNWRIFKNRYSRSLDDITIYSTNGIVGDYLEIVLASDTMLAAGSLEDGVSCLLLDDIDNPKGKVQSYIGPNTGIAGDRFGFSGLAIHPNNGKMYAWYNQEIIDLVELKPICSDAPGFTHATYGARAATRFVIDQEGHFWIGISNLDSKGDVRNHGENGLFRITVENGKSNKEKIFEYAVWHLYKDKENTLWASTNEGLFKVDSETKEYEEFKLERTEWSKCFVEQVIEYEDKLYAIAKNFFHNPVNIETQFALYEIKSGEKELEHVVDISKEDETWANQTRAFVYKNTLYFFLGNSLKKLVSAPNPEIVDTDLNESGDVEFGKYSHSVVGDTLYSVGNIGGISIFDDDRHTCLTQATTAEGLVSDSIFTIYVSPDQNTVYVGPYISGSFNRLRGESITTYPFFNEVSTSSFFDYEGDTYVVGTRMVGKLTDNEIEPVATFPTNGERTTFDPSGFLWGYPNFGDNPTGVIGMMNLKTYEIKRTKEPNGNDYFIGWGEVENDTSLFWDSQFNQDYHFNHVYPIPGSSDMMIAVSKGTGDFKTNPHTLRYSHANNKFTKVPITDKSSEGIMYMASDGTALYGVGRQKLFVLEDSGWVEKCPIIIGNDFRDMVIVEDYAIIASGWNSDGPGEGDGFEILNLNSGESKFYTTKNTPLPSDAVFALAAQKVGSVKYRIWFGTNDGLAYCTVNLP